MFLVLYPHNAIQGMLCESGVLRGDRSDLENPFRWGEIRLNLPGNPNYPPRVPWISKVQGISQDMAGYFTTYVDDFIVAEGSS